MTQLKFIFLLAMFLCIGASFTQEAQAEGPNPANEKDSDVFLKGKYYQKTDRIEKCPKYIYIDSNRSDVDTGEITLKSNTYYVNTKEMDHPTKSTVAVHSGNYCVGIIWNYKTRRFYASQFNKRNSAFTCGHRYNQPERYQVFFGSGVKRGCKNVMSYIHKLPVELLYPDEFQEETEYLQQFQLQPSANESCRCKCDSFIRYAKNGCTCLCGKDKKLYPAYLEFPDEFAE